MLFEFNVLICERKIADNFLINCTHYPHKQIMLGAQLKLNNRCNLMNLSVHFSQMIFFVILFYLRVAAEPLNRVKRVVNGDEIEITHWPWLVHLWVSFTHRGIVLEV